MANIYSDAKKDMEFLLRNMGQLTQPKMESDDGKGYYHITYFRPDGYMYEGKGQYGFWEFNPRAFKVKYPDKEPDPDLLNCTLEANIKRISKIYDRLNRMYNKRLTYDKKMEETRIDATQKAMVALSAHRSLLPLIKEFLETQERKPNYGDNLHDFWMYIQNPKGYKKAKPYTDINVRSPYGGYCTKTIKTPLKEDDIAKKLGFGSFPLSLYAFNHIPESWWRNPEDTIPAVAKSVAECILVKGERTDTPAPKVYVQLSLFD